MACRGNTKALTKMAKVYKSRWGLLQKRPKILIFVFVCVEVLRPSQPNGVMSSAASLPNHTFTGQG